MNEIGKMTRREWLAHVGDMSQIAGVRRYFIEDGRARGVEAIDCNAGNLKFTVLPGRGMDIAWSSFAGLTLGFMSKAEVSSAENYEPAGMGWLRNFYAGLLTTCGLSNVGDPCDTQDVQLGTVHHGLHGRIANTGASQVCYRAEWQGDDYVLSVSGQMRESLLHGENLVIKRTITTRMGADHLHVEDHVTNDGFKTQPLMLLYHINAGYPVLSPASRMILPTRGVIPGTPAAEREPNSYNDFTGPTHEAEQFVYQHILGDDAGKTQAGLYNPELGHGLYVKFDKAQLPCFMQWKRLSQGDYVVGLEPANCQAVGQIEMARRGALQFIEPGETRCFQLEIGALHAGNIGDFAGTVQSLERLCAT